PPLSGTLTCTPPPLAAGTLPFALHLGDTPVPSSRVLSVLLADGAAPVVLAVSPSVGPAGRGGATRVTVLGAALPETLRCRFGSVVSVARRVSSDVVVCEAAASLPGGVDVSLEADGAPIYGMLRFEFHAVWEVHAVFPVWAPSDVTVSITVMGERFFDSEAGLSCRVGGAYLAATFINETAIRCDSPGLVPGNHSVSVSSNGEAFAFAADTIRVFTTAAPLLQPSIAYSRGGTVVTVTSPRFVSDAHTASPPAVMFDQEVVKCALQVLTDDGYKNEVVETPLLYRIAPQNTVASVFPSSTSSPGGSLVQVTGTGFTPESDLKCMFGQLPARALVLSSSIIECETPAHAPGPVLLTMIPRDHPTGHEGALATLPFTFYAPPAIHTVRLAPDVALPTVRITGEHFVKSAGFACRFAGKHEVVGSFLSSTSAACVLPAGAAGNISVEVSNDGVAFHGAASFK
ncbi:hypothetical protein T484DRAFT_1797522, partial [Baffinella frigidus]